MQKTLFSNSISNSSQTFSRVTTKTALAITLAMAALSIAVSPVAHAAPNSNKNTNGPANVVAHVAVAAGSATRMLLIKRNGKEYLILGLDSSAQIAVVDVSDPRRPQNLDAAAPAPGKPATELNVIADTLSVFGKSDAAPAASADPKELRNISGVTVFLVDNAHGLIYAANNDGLWIVKTQRQAAEDAHADYYGG
jgi:hypothetical protein